MGLRRGIQQSGVFAALAAFLFGAGTPLAKLLLATADPWLLAGLLYPKPSSCVRPSSGFASLWAAIAAGMGASLLVIFNGLRLLR